MTRRADTSGAPSGARPRGRRAARVAETRRRIAQAAADLHTSVGPARTTISAIAERAGVQRHTVYAHFPDERELFRACAGLWQEQNPFPDEGAWRRIADPRERLRRALEDVYAFYERSGEDLLRVFEGAEALPVMRDFIEHDNRASLRRAEALARGRGVRGRRRARLIAAIRHGLSAETWRSLCRAGGLSPKEAVGLMCALADAACTGDAAAGGRADAARPRAAQRPSIAAAAISRSATSAR